MHDCEDIILNYFNLVKSDVDSYVLFINITKKIIIIKNYH